MKLFLEVASGSRDANSFKKKQKIDDGKLIVFEEIKGLRSVQY